MVKYFKSNDEFFEFIRKNKEKVKILELNILKSRIKISYERKKS